MNAKGFLQSRRKEILKLAHRYGVVRIRLFGSVARGEESSGSDFDFLVAFESGRSLLDLIGFKQDLGALLGKEVDVVSEKGISPYLKDQIFGGAIPL